MTREEQQPPMPAQGSDTLLHVLNEAADGGYGTQFIPRGDGLIECVGCASANGPAAFDIVHYRRLEGASDPADMLIVVWSACPTCEAHGTVTLGYGPNATGADASVLAQFDLHHADPAPAAPRVGSRQPTPTPDED